MASSGPSTDDYFAATQYWFNNTGSYSKFYVTGTTSIPSAEDIDIDGPEGWELYSALSPSRRAVIAVIDTGINTKPELFAGRILDGGMNFSNSVTSSSLNSYPLCAAALII